MTTLIKYFQDNKGQMLRYAVVGGTGAIIDFGVLYILYEQAHIYYRIAAAASFIFSALLNYYLNRVWTFKNFKDPKRQMLIFAAVAISGLIINDKILKFLVDGWQVPVMLAKVASVAIVTVWNFLWNKYLTFKA